MRQAARDARAAHGAEAELQSEQYEALAAQLRRSQEAAAEQLQAARVLHACTAIAWLHAPARPVLPGTCSAIPCMRTAKESEV